MIGVIVIKRKTAKEILSESFREVAKSRPIDKITIKDITDNCGYSPATFYRQFSDKYDLIAWDYVYRTTKIMNKVGIDDYRWNDTWFDAFRFFEDNLHYLKNLLEHTNGHNSFVRYMSSANANHMSVCIKQINRLNEFDDDLMIYIQTYCYGTAQIACEWILGNINMDGEHLAGLFEKALPEPLKEYLY